MINSARIQEICGQVTGKVIAEIGCDHALITKNLFENGKIEFAYLTDISEKCLEKAKKNLIGYKTKTAFRVGDGLKALEFKDVQNIQNVQSLQNTTENNNLNSNNKNYPKPQQIIIAGMGGAEIIKILSQDEAQKYTNFILQPQKNIIEVRTYLQNNGFELVRDEITKEGKIFYFVINAVRTRKSVPLTPMQLHFGSPQNVDILKNYLNFKLQKCNEISAKTNSEENEILIKLITERLKTIS